MAKMWTAILLLALAIGERQTSALEECAELLVYDPTTKMCVDTSTYVCGDIVTTQTATTTANSDGTAETITITTIDVMPNEDPFADEAVTYPIAVSVARTTNQTTFSEPLVLPEIVVNLGVAWDSATNMVTCPNTVPQVYFIHLNAGTMQNEQINFNIRGAVSTADIYRNSTAINGIDTISRDIIQTIQPNSQIFVECQLKCNSPKLYSDSGRHTSFTIFNLEEHMEPTDMRIFGAARIADHSTKGELPLNNVLANIGAGYTGERFTANVSGIYYFTVSIGIKGTQMQAQLMKNDVGPIAELLRTSTTVDSKDIASASAMVNLNVGDYIYVNYLLGDTWSSFDRQTTFGGFRYDPVNITGHAWSVYRDTSLLAPSTGPVNPLPWNGVHVNTGLFNVVDNHVHIIQTGIYYVDLHVGVMGGATMDAFLVRADSRSEFDISRSIGYQNGIDVLGNGILLEMNEFETLKVVLGADTGLYSDSSKQTVWNGFLLTEKTFY